MTTDAVSVAEEAGDVLVLVLVVAGIGACVVGCYCLGFGLMSKEVERAEEEEEEGP